MSTKEERDRDFRSCCADIRRACCAGGRTPCPAEVYARAMAMSPRCFYTDTVYAYEKLRRIFRHGTDGAWRASEGMWLELAAMVAVEMLRSRSSLMAALSAVLCTRRPSSFHLSPDSARRLASERPRRRRNVSPPESSAPCLL